MDENKIICTECSTENEPQYEYCKNCGALLKANEPIKPEPAPFYDANGQVPNENFTQNDPNMYSPYPEVETIDGVSLDEMAAFIGKKSFAIMPKFLKMERNNSKISFCWPVAVLGWFFGPLGAALWFFYRKMHKIAWLLVLAGALLLTVTSYVALKDFPINFKDMINEINYVVENSAPGEEEYALQEIMDKYVSDIEEYSEQTETTLLNNINKVVDILTAVLGGMFAYWLYKRKAVEKIKQYRNNNVDPRYYRMGLMFQGGTSGGMLALGIALLILVPLISVFAIMFAVLF